MRMAGTTFSKRAGVIATAVGLTLILAQAGLVKEVKPVNPFASSRVAASPRKSAPKYDVVNYRADHMRALWGKQETATLTGDVRFTSGDTVLSSALVEWNEKAQTAVSPGKLTIDNPQCDITGDKGTAFFKKRLGVVEDDVVMLLKPKHVPTPTANKQSIRAKLSQPTTVTCKKIEYLYKKKIATASGGVLFKQPKRTASADRAIYDQNNELLTLIGHVRATDEKGQTFSAPGKVIISLKKGDEWLEAKDASASFKVKSE